MSKLTYVPKTSKKKKKKDTSVPPEELWKRNVNASVKSTVALPAHLEEEQKRAAAENRERNDSNSNQKRIRSLNHICMDTILCFVDRFLVEIDKLPFVLRNQLLSSALQQGTLDIHILSELFRILTSRCRYTQEEATKIAHSPRDGKIRFFPRKIPRYDQ